MAENSSPHETPPSATTAATVTKPTRAVGPGQTVPLSSRPRALTNIINAPAATPIFLLHGSVNGSPHTRIHSLARTNPAAPQPQSPTSSALIETKTSYFLTLHVTPEPGRHQHVGVVVPAGTSWEALVETITAEIPERAVVPSREQRADMLFPLRLSIRPERGGKLQTWECNTATEFGRFLSDVEMLRLPVGAPVDVWFSSPSGEDCSNSKALS